MDISDILFFSVWGRRKGRKRPKRWRWGVGFPLKIEGGGGVSYEEGGTCAARTSARRRAVGGGAKFVRGLLGTSPPDSTLESASPSPTQGSIWHRFNIDLTLMRHRFPDLILSRCRINVEPMLNRCQIDPWGGEGEAVPNKPLTRLDPKTTWNAYQAMGKRHNTTVGLATWTGLKLGQQVLQNRGKNAKRANGTYFARPHPPPSSEPPPCLFSISELFNQPKVFLQ